MKIDVTIEGTQPMLQSNPASRSTTGLMDMPPEEQIVPRLYRNAKGQPTVPSNQILTAMEKSAAAFKIPGARGKTYRDSITALVYMEPSYIPIEGDYVADTQRAITPSTKGEAIVSRPRFDQWKVSFTMHVADIGTDKIPPDILKNILVRAGVFNGIGTFRKRFGKFKVSVFDIK